MTTVVQFRQAQYPESDGKPMGETDELAPRETERANREALARQSAELELARLREELARRQA